MSTFYTRKGDDGFTGLLGPDRVPKDHPRLEAVGALDEASAALGLARSLAQAGQTAPILLAVQRDLYGLMAETVAVRENAAQFRTINPRRVSWLEEQTDQISGQVVVPAEFIVPGDTQAGAALSLARTIVRRAERRAVELYHAGEIENLEILRYLNRLSSLCFVLELLENKAAGSTRITLAKGDSST